MLKAVWVWFFGQSLESKLNETFKVKINGIRFEIKRVGVLDYLDGSKVMLQVHDLYKQGKQNEISETSQKKVKEHLSQVIVAGVVHPKLSFKQEQGAVCVDDLFVDFELVNGLYENIMAVSYGKKSGTKHLARARLEEIDHLAKRYGVRPSVFLKDDLASYNFDLLVASTGVEAEIRANKMQGKARRGK